MIGPRRVSPVRRLYNETRYWDFAHRRELSKQELREQLAAAVANTTVAPRVAAESVRGARGPGKAR